jgi:hypothetical protein
MNPKKVRVSDISGNPKHLSIADDQYIDLSKIPESLRQRFVTDLQDILAAELPAMTVTVSKGRLKAHDGVTEVGVSAKALKLQAEQAGVTVLSFPGGASIDVSKLRDSDFVNIHAEVERPSKELPRK